MSGRNKLKGLKILVVEDEAVIGLDIADLLARAGCEAVGPCVDVASAIRALDEETPDGAILDLRLGSEQSLHIADTLTRLAIPFIWASGYDKNVLPERFKGHPLIKKPFDTAEFLEAIETAFGSSARAS